MAVTHTPRQPSRLWSRLHVALRVAGLTGFLLACVGLAMLEPDSPAGTWLLVLGVVLAGAALVVEIVAALRLVAGSRSAFHLNALGQALLAAVVLLAVNVLAFRHYERLDTTRGKQFTLPAELREQLRQLDPDRETTVVVFQRHKTFGNLTDKPDHYDSAAEHKVVEKVRDLVELLREAGQQQGRKPRIRVEVLDVEERGYEKQLDRLTKGAPNLRKAIEATPENSIFITARDPANPEHLFVQQMSFNELYQLDRVRSAADNNGRGNLVLLGQGSDGRGIHPFVRRILNVQQRRPRVGILVIHELLTSEGSEDTFTLAGLRKALQANGFEVHDVVLKKGWEGRGPGLEAAADTTEESKLERLESEIESLDEDIRDLHAQIKAQKRGIEEVKKRGPAGLLRLLEGGLKQIEEELADKQRERRRAQQERDRMDLDRLAESRRLSDVKAKLNYAVSDFDMLFVPRLTRLSSGRLILPRLHNLQAEQVEVIRDFLKAGKPLLACLGPINDQPDTPASPMLGPPGPDDLERALGELGFRLSKQTVLFSADARAFAERRRDMLRGSAGVEVPPLDFDVPTSEGYPEGLRPPPQPDNPLRAGLRVMAHSVGSGFDLHLRFLRPVYFERRDGKKPPYDPIFLMTATGWNENQPFATGERRPRYTAPKEDDPDRGTLDARRRGPFPVGAAAEVPLPNSWGGAKGQKVRVAVIGQGDVFVGPKLSPARERLFLETANWLLGRDDYLPSDEHVWRYPRLELTPEDWQYRRWRDLAVWGLPLLFAYVGFVVLLYRRLR